MVMARGICSGFSGLPALVEHSIGQLLETASPRVEPIPFEVAVEPGVTVVEQEPALWRDDFETSVTLPQARPVACWQPKAHAGSAS